MIHTTMASTILHSQQRAASGTELVNSDAMAFVHADDLRTAFAAAMSQMYKEEVPLYGDLVRIVSGVNKQILSDSSKEPPTADRLERLVLERHGAIRLGTARELGIVRRIFALMGMHPVGYYDLSVAGLPMHATCFRPITESSLARNPFRIFTTLLRPDLIQSEVAKDLALRLLSERSIFSQELMQLLDVAERQNDRLGCEQAETFIREALQTFRWAPVAACTHAEYQLLKEEHPILADIACFKTAHINHLTPRTLDIGCAQQAMLSEHMAVKERIEGPPLRKCPILLRQTSFLAMEERVQFRSGNHQAAQLIDGAHRARFGEIEERGAAVTPAGRALYDRLLKEASDLALGLTSEEADRAFEATFQKFPDTWNGMRKKGLVYFKYQWTGKPCDLTVINTGQSRNEDLSDGLITAGVIETVPITYEDFLPFSAAGIFQSNLRRGLGLQQRSVESLSDFNGLEAALGCSVVDADSLYSDAQQQSLKSCLGKLKQFVSEL